MKETVENIAKNVAKYMINRRKSIRKLPKIDKKIAKNAKQIRDYNTCSKKYEETAQTMKETVKNIGPKS